jgi:hypothetical protein
MRQSELLARQARLIERSASLRASVHAHAADIAAPFSNARQAVDGIRVLPASQILGLLALGLAGRKFGQGLLPLLGLWDMWRAWKT